MFGYLMKYLKFCLDNSTDFGGLLKCSLDEFD